MASCGEGQTVISRTSTPSNKSDSMRFDALLESPMPLITSRYSPWQGIRHFIRVKTSLMKSFMSTGSPDDRSKLPGLEYKAKPHLICCSTVSCNVSDVRRLSHKEDDNVILWCIILHTLYIILEIMDGR